MEAFVTASVVTGWLHSCALTSDGTAYCWGDNGYGQLGSERIQCAPISNPGIYCALTPTPVREGLTFTSLSAGAYHTCGITPGDELYCWGLNSDDQLGVETTELCISGIHKCSTRPLRVGSGIGTVDGGFTHTCALSTSGQPYCWGGNLFGQLGVDDTDNRSTPTEVLGNHTFASIESGGYHTCGLTPAGVAYCWGANQRGQLGAPSSDTCYYFVGYPCSMTPIPVSGGLSFTSLNLGHQHTCGIVPAAPSSTSAAPGRRQSVAMEPSVLFVTHSVPARTARTTSVAKPAAPTNLQASAVSSSQINLQWTDNSSNEDGFEVWRAHGRQYTLVATLGPNVTSYGDTGLQPATTYAYGVVAFNTAGNSLPSNAASATTHPTAPPPPPPAAPSALVANAASSDRVDLAWADNSGNEDGFRIERHAGDGDFTQIAIVGANVTAYTDAPLQEGTGYTYRVQAFNAGGASSWSNPTSATTWLNTPTSLAAQALSSSQIGLTWNDNSQRESGYQIQRRTAGTGFAPIATVGANVTSYSDAGLQASTTYTYRVRASGPGTTSAWSNETSATTGSEAPPPPPPPSPPAAPSDLQASAVSSSQINLQWTDNASNEDGFEVWRAHNRQYTLVATLGPNVTGYSDTGLQPVTTYAYGVVAFNTAGNSLPSNAASATTHPAAPPPSPPAAPSALEANAASSSQVDLTWTDNAGNEDGFRIERHAGSGNFTPIATVGANVTSFSDMNASAGTYSYRVQAYNTAGSSGYSNTATKPADPSDLTADLLPFNRIELSWSDNSGNEDGFIIEQKAGDGAFVEIFRTQVHWYQTGTLEPGTTYTYRVRAFIWESGASAYSNEASATTPGAPTTGNAYCWGQNVRGQLGINSLDDFVTTPTRVDGGLDFRMVTTGVDHTCGVATDGRGYCWGWNGDGQFGNGGQGSGAGSRIPVPMGSGLTWQAIRGGEKHSCGLSPGGETYCWGQNHRGQIGDGTRNNWRLVPTPVLPPSP